MSEKISKITRSNIMSKVKNKDTYIEMLTRSYLHRKGFRFRFRVNDNRYPGRPDIVLPKYKTIIFVNGCFWHMHGCKRSAIPKTNKEFWEEKLKRNRERDKRNKDLLEKDGWNVIIIWECELIKDFEAVMTSVIKRLENEV
jgi:DNA mismatch endonuclease (patch repair protein)